MSGAKNTKPVKLSPLLMVNFGHHAVLRSIKYRAGEIAGYDNLLGLFGTEDPDELYAEALRDPNSFLAKLRQWCKDEYLDHEEDAFEIKTWLTMAYMQEWRKDRSNEASREAWVGWLQEQLEQAKRAANVQAAKKRLAEEKEEAKKAKKAKRA